MSNYHNSEIPNDDHDDLELDGSLGYFADRARAIERLLIDKGICTAQEIQLQIDERESRSPAAVSYTHLTLQTKA